MYFFEKDSLIVLSKYSVKILHREFFSLLSITLSRKLFLNSLLKFLLFVDLFDIVFCKYYTSAQLSDILL